jgi:hypothetical protein
MTATPTPAKSSVFRKNTVPWWLTLTVFVTLAVVLVIILKLTLFYPAVSEPFVPASATDEVKVLQGQLDAINRYHSDVISTVWGALTAMAAVIVVVAAIGTLQSRQTYERDREDLNNRLDDRLEKEHEQRDRALETAKNDLTKEITAVGSRINNLDNAVMHVSNDLQEQLQRDYQRTTQLVRPMLLRLQLLEERTRLEDRVSKYGKAAAFQVFGPFLNSARQLNEVSPMQNTDQIYWGLQLLGEIVEDEESMGRQSLGDIQIVLGQLRPFATLPAFDRLATTTVAILEDLQKKRTPQENS